MEHLRIRADRFRKQGRLEEGEMEAIIREIREEYEEKEGGDQARGETRAEEHARVLEAVGEGLLQTHGIAPNSKQEGIFRMMCENANGFHNRISGNQKIAKALDIKEDLDIDCLLYCEHRLNLRHQSNVNDIKQMFQREIACTAVAAHNVHEWKQAGRVQEGGTGAICFGDATGYIRKVGKDEEGLGRWSWILLGGSDGHMTRLITAYNPCKSGKANSGTSYQQQRRYFIMKKQDLTCPRTLFRRHLTAALEKWRAAGERLVLFMDHNEHVYDGTLGKMLGDREGLNLREVILDKTGVQTGATFFRGSQPIDGLWASSDLVISNACVMPFGYGVGDHRAFILDIPLESLIGINPVRIVRPASRRLNSRIPGCGKAYIKSLEGNIIRHRLIERLHEAHTGEYTAEERARRVIIIDEEGKTYMRHAEKICRKIKSCRIPFSPEAAIWIRRVQVYYSLLRYHKGRVKNRGNLKRAARRCNIPNPLAMSMAEIYDRLKECKRECVFYQEHGKRFRQKHLNARLLLAQEKEDEEAINKISAIIQREKQRNFWRRLNYCTGKKRTRSATTIQTEAPGGAIVEHTTREPVEQTIFTEIHNKRYTMAGEAPICNGDLFEEFGYTSNTTAGQAVLDGTYVAPAGTDPATVELFAEVAEIRKRIPKDSVVTCITPQQWQRYWRAVNEETSSSESGLHFGHYVVGGASDIISYYHAARVTVVIAHAIRLERWSRGLSVMLEKTLGVTLVTKLRAILLMEADFNATNKIIYGNRMMENARRYNLMPEEIFSERNRMADDGTLCKTLFCDLARQARVPAAIASVDASNCYDRIAHAMASLVFQAFGVPGAAAESMLGTIENMKFFLRTGFGDSTNFAGGGVSIKTQGMCQGNGASPAGWAVISICILSAHGKKGHGAKFICPVTKLTRHLSAILYVDDTDILHIDLTKDERVDEVHERIQASVNSWGNLLIATGGALQPAKCFYSIISFEWLNGVWRYASNELRTDLGISVPLPGGGAAGIGHKAVKHAEKTLGAMTSPDGSSRAAIMMMQDKAQQWLTDVRDGRLHRRDVWFSLKFQLVPRIVYGLCSSTASFEELHEAMRKQYYQILPLGGVVRTAPVESRTITPGFFGIGLPHLGVEALVAMSNKLLMHYGCDTATGRFMRSSHSLFLLELGISAQPLQESYERYSFLSTHSWMKMLWEKLSKFGVWTFIADGVVENPRAGDRFLMQAFVEKGYPRDILLRLNRVRVYWQALFVSDIMTASGLKVDPEVLGRPTVYRKRSHLRWPTEHPTASDFQTWRDAIVSLCPSRNAAGLRLGAFAIAAHRRWEWRWDEESGCLCRNSAGSESEDVFRAGRRPNRFYYSETRPSTSGGRSCSVEPTHAGQVEGGWRLTSVAQTVISDAPPRNFMEVLQSWGNTWLWDNILLIGEHGWITDAISDGTLLAVTDGSFIREQYPTLCSAAFVLECTKGRGRMIGSFSESSRVANAYRGELLGLMAIHLILRSVDIAHGGNGGSVEVVSDCLGALRRVTDLPPYRIPSRCKHSDILKNILVHCRSLSFTIHYRHVRAHQDDATSFKKLSRKAQLNCICDHTAKQRIAADGSGSERPERMFPLEPIGMFVNGGKLTSDTGDTLRFWAHRQIARRYYHSKGIISHDQFDETDWGSLQSTLTSLPRLFQLWAAKHVNKIAGTMSFLSHQDGRSNLCPSCEACEETCPHIARCPEAGRSSAFAQSTEELDLWLGTSQTHPDLHSMLLRYTRGRGTVTCLDCAISLDLPPILQDLARSQDVIGWDLYMMGMLSSKLAAVQSVYLLQHHSTRPVSKWLSGLITQLLQVTHCQWIYRCVLVHDRSTGTLISAHKEEMLKEIEHQLDLGEGGLAEEDKFLLECNFDELVTTNGEQQEYWILAVQAAREACRLRAAARGTPFAAGAVAIQEAAGEGAPQRGGLVVCRLDNIRPRRGRGRTKAWVTSQRRRRGTTAG